MPTPTPTAETGSTTEAPRWVDLAAGGRANCALHSSGSVYCWGPTAERAGFAGWRQGPFTAVEMGAEHVCGLDPAGAAVCWGDAEYNPAVRSASGPFVALVVGGYASCGLSAAGDLTCWGWFGTTEETWAPTQIASGVTDADVGDQVIAAVVGAEQKVFCTGGGAEQVRAVPPPDVDRLALVALGYLHGCGVREVPGPAVCWGSSSAGPEWIAPEPPLGAFVRLDAEGGSTCGLSAEGELACWNAGEDEVGLHVRPSGRVVDFGVGVWHVCALLESGEVECWGYAFSTELDPPPDP